MTFAHVEGLRLLDQNLINYFQNFANGTKFLKRTKPSSNLIKKLNDVDWTFPSLCHHAMNYKDYKSSPNFCVI